MYNCIYGDEFLIILKISKINFISRCVMGCHCPASVFPEKYTEVSLQCHKFKVNS